MAMPQQVYVRLYAGMGDFYKRYFLHPTWACLKDLKAKHPEVSVHALLSSQTVPALNFVDYHPYLDRVVVPGLHPRQIKQAGADTFMNGYVPLGPGAAKRFQLEPPPVYLPKKDKVFVDNLTKGKDKYIIVHPFSGDRLGNTTRTPIRPVRYIPVIESLIGLGYRVILLGSTWKRKDERGVQIREETFKWNIKGLTNLIDRTNVRTGAELVKRSSGFVGTASCFMCAAWSIGNIRSVIIISERWREPLETMPWAKDRCKEPQNKIIYLPPTRTPQTFEDMTNDTADWFS
jgi:ADP-heptose:LPS heptosyltransferase